MAKSKYITVMISSRCNDAIEYKGTPTTLSDVRTELKSQIEGLELCGERMFQCWINELETSLERTHDSWDKCLEEVKDTDIVIVLYNGNAGWTTSAGGIGICHAELKTALETGPAKVRLVQLPLVITTVKKAPYPNNEHGRMRRYVDEQNLFRGKEVASGEELIDHVLTTLARAVVEMAKLGGLETRKGQYDTGQALDWSRLDFSQRKEAMESVMRQALKQRHGAAIAGKLYFVKLDSKQVLFCCHAVPAAMTVAAAREMVGMPFLKDHEFAEDLSGSKIGPVHLIACHKSVSESQAIKLLGFPDATIVEPPFGIYVADRIQNIQLLLLRHCRDETTTRHALQRAFDWLERSGEADFLVHRAASRTKIIKAIAKEAGR